MDGVTLSDGAIESEALFNEALAQLGEPPWSDNPAFELGYVHSYTPSDFWVQLVAPNAAPLGFCFSSVFQIELPGGAPIEIDQARFRDAHGVIPSVIDVLTARISVRYSKLVRATKCTITLPTEPPRSGSSTVYHAIWSSWPKSVRGTTTTYEPFTTR